MNFAICGEEPGLKNLMHREVTVNENTKFVSEELPSIPGEMTVHKDMLQSLIGVTMLAF